MSVYDILKKRKYVLDYETHAEIDKELIIDLLQKAWKVTPSKNNFMPYKVHVIGPERRKLKESIFLKSLKHEGAADNIDVIERYENRGKLPNYRNIRSCSYLLIFTLRQETDPNPFQKWLFEQGHNYPAMRNVEECYADALLEIGMFSTAFGAMCLEHDIDIAPVGCYPKDLKDWKDVSFINQYPPIGLLTVGKGKYYRQDHARKINEREKDDWKPNFSKVVNMENI
tara:strand:- start:61 stop:741 length:681 start_codon:yes stop_codon:yes gene_type:complete